MFIYRASKERYIAHIKATKLLLLVILLQIIQKKMHQYIAHDITTAYILERFLYYFFMLPSSFE